MEDVPPLWRIRTDSQMERDLGVDNVQFRERLRLTPNRIAIATETAPQCPPRALLRTRPATLGRVGPPTKECFARVIPACRPTLLLCVVRSKAFSLFIFLHAARTI